MTLAMITPPNGRQRQGPSGPTKGQVSPLSPTLTARQGRQRHDGAERLASTSQLATPAPILEEGGGIALDGIDQESWELRTETVEEDLGDEEGVSRTSEIDIGKSDLSIASYISAPVGDSDEEY